MTFLNPALLWGLLAISVPIIVHFFNLQRPKQVLFSNVAFVREVKKTVVRRLKLKQWLLLLARILAVAFLVLAFANPVVVNENAQVLQANRSIAIILDNSYSMNAGNERGNYFQQAIGLSRNIIESYSKQDEYLLMTTNELRLNYNFAEQEEAISELSDLKVEQNIRPQSEILSFSDEIFSRANNQVQELYFISDFQSSTVLADSQIVSLDDSSLLVKYIPVATRKQNNVYVENQEILSQIVEKGKPVRMKMTLVNDGDSDAKELGVRVLLEGKVVAIANKDVEANSSTEVELTFTPAVTGWLAGHIELDDYPIEFDNKRFFSLYVPETEKVLVVEGDISRNVRILYQDVFAAFDATVISAKSLSTVQLTDFRSIMIVGMKEVSSGLGEQLTNFVQEGGSIALFPGNEMKLESVNPFLSSVGVGKFTEAKKVQEGTKVTQVDLDHPIFDGVYEGDAKSKEFDAPMVFKYHPLELNNDSVQNRIMSLDNQEPVMVETQVGSGRIYTFNTFPGDAWTDFHVKTSFPAIMFRLTQMMNQTRNVQEGQEIGFFTPKSIRTSQKGMISLRGADGFELIPEQYVRAGATVLNFEQLEVKEGTYALVQEDSVLEKLAFNISDLESRLKFTGEDELNEQLQQAGYDQISVLPPVADSVERQIQVEKEGTPLWKYCLILAILFLLAEVLILKIKE